VKLALDANLPSAIARAVHALLMPYGGRAIHIRDHFGPAVTDLEWIGKLHGDGGWAVLTADRRLRTRPHERQALRDTELVVFILASGWNQAGYWSQAAGIIRWLPHMIEAAATHKPPVLLDIPHHFSPRPIRRLGRG
jgi:hypothetical protein